jgi:long-chain fatty acid transport protein
MTSITTRTLSALAVGASFFAAATGADASSFYLRTGQGAEGVALQFAGAAAGGIGLPSIRWNPATITMFPGRTSSWNFALIYPQASYNLEHSSLPPALRRPVGEIGGDWSFIPSSASAWQITDRLWVGLSTAAPWGLRSKAENLDNAAQIYGRSSKVRSLNVTPTVGFKLNEWISFGAGVQIQYFKVDLKQAFGVPAATAVLPGAPNSILRGDDYALGFNLGVNITPWQGTSIGVGYRSEMRHDVTGNVILPAAAPPLLGIGRNPIRADVTLPDAVMLGISHQFTPQLQAHLGLEFSFWSKLFRVPVRLRANGIEINSLNFEYRDSVFMSGGVEYAFTPNLAVRAGVSYELSAVTDRVRTPRISDNDRLGVSVGVGYKWSDQLSVDASYAHYFIKEAPVNMVRGNPWWQGVDYVGVARPSVDVFALGITYRWDAPAAAAAAPLIRKN